MSETDELLDIEQAAKFLNVSETSLRRGTNAGRLACLRVGRRRERRFRRADLLAFMEDEPAAAQARAPRASSSHPPLFDYEAGSDELIARRFPLVCQYDVRAFSGVTLFKTLKLHRDAFRYPADCMLG
jgi:excisionase family DNA binding protein